MDITVEMSRFKEASRHLWNTYLVPAGGSASIATIQAFEEIERALLKELVLRELGADARAADYRRGPTKGIVVRPNEYLTDIPLQLAEVMENKSVRWSESRRVPVGTLGEIEFYDFFDWNPYGLRDFSFVRAVVEGSSQLCLLESADVAFEFIQAPDLMRSASV